MTYHSCSCYVLYTTGRALLFSPYSSLWWQVCPSYSTANQPWCWYKLSRCCTELLHSIFIDFKIVFPTEGWHSSSLGSTRRSTWNSQDTSAVSSQSQCQRQSEHWISLTGSTLAIMPYTTMYIVHSLSYDIPNFFQNFGISNYTIILFNMKLGNSLPLSVKVSIILAINGARVQLKC